MQFTGRVLSTPQTIIDFCADHFESTYIADEQQWMFDDVFHSLWSPKEIKVTLFDVESANYSLKWKGTVGPDEISPYVTKMCADSIIWPIWLLFPKTFETAIKKGWNRHVFKKGKRKLWQSVPQFSRYSKESWRLNWCQLLSKRSYRMHNMDSGLSDQ